MDANPQQPPVKPTWLNRPIPPALRMYGGIWLAIIAALCAPLVAYLPGAPLLLLYMLIAGIALGLLARKAAQLILIAGAALVLAALILYGGMLTRVQDNGGADAGRDAGRIPCAPGWSYSGQGPGAELEQNLHAVHSALENYASEHDGRYPLELSTLVSEGYIARLPENPLRKALAPAQHPAAGGAQARPEMLALGDDLFQGGEFPQFAGNIAYLPDIQASADGAAYAQDFLLVAFAEGSLRPMLFSARRPVITPAVLVSSRLDSYACYDIPRQ